MLYTSKQAAAILGCTSGTLNKLAQAGKIQAEPRPENTKRAHYHFKPSVVKEFKKTYRNRLNGKHKKNKFSPAYIDSLPQPTGIVSRLNNLENEVKALKKSIEYLVKLWS